MADWIYFAVILNIRLINKIQGINSRYFLFIVRRISLWGGYIPCHQHWSSFHFFKQIPRTANTSRPPSLSYKTTIKEIRIGPWFLGYNLHSLSTPLPVILSCGTLTGSQSCTSDCTCEVRNYKEKKRPKVHPQDQFNRFFRDLLQMWRVPLWSWWSWIELIEVGDKVNHRVPCPPCVPQWW